MALGSREGPFREITARDDGPRDGAGENER